MEYQVGSLQFPKEDDRRFEAYDGALNYAVEESIDDSIYGVWVRENGIRDGDLEAIVYGSEVFEK